MGLWDDIKGGAKWVGGKAKQATYATVGAVGGEAAAHQACYKTESAQVFALMAANTEDRFELIPPSPAFFDEHASMLYQGMLNLMDVSFTAAPALHMVFNPKIEGIRTLVIPLKGVPLTPAQNAVRALVIPRDFTGHQEGRLTSSMLREAFQALSPYMIFSCG